MTPKIKAFLKKVSSKVSSKLRRRSHSNEYQPEENGGDDQFQAKTRHLSLIESVDNLALTAKPRRHSIALLSTTMFHRRSRTSTDSYQPDPVLPPELIEKIASYLSQSDLKRFCKVSSGAYTAAERHLYRRPYTRRYDKLLRTLERSPYKADLILELAFGFETDFYSVKGPCYDREKVYSAILARTRNLQQLVYQGWLQWTVSVAQPFAARHPFVTTIPTRVQTGSVPLDLLQNIPSTLTHLQFRRIYGRYDNLLDVIKRNDRLEILNLYEVGDLDAIHLEKIVDCPIAQNLKILRLRHLPAQLEKDYGTMMAKLLPKLTSLQTFTLEICSMKDEPFFSTFVRCKTIQHFKFGYCDDITMEGLSKLSQHGELRSLELMPCLRFDVEALRAIIVGNPHLALLLLPKETVTKELQKELPSLLRISNVRIYIKAPSYDFELSMRQRMLRPPPMQLHAL